MIGGNYSDLEGLERGCTRTSLPVTKRKLRVAVEGNIASGKSTLLSKLSQLSSVEVLIEPVDEWRNLAGGNLIGRMYEDAGRWGYLFQSYVLLTMMELHHKEVDSPIIMLERSVYSARYCFVENLHRSNIIDDMEYACYCQWFDYIMKQNRPQLDLIVYLRSSPEVCFQRLLKRARMEEKPVKLDYLRSLHDRYEEWLANDTNHTWHGAAPVLVIDANEDCTQSTTLHDKYCSHILTKLGLCEPNRTPPLSVTC